MLLVSQVSFVLDSTMSQGLLPLSKSGSRQVSWWRIGFDSGLGSKDTGASSSTSVGSGVFSGETTDSDTGRTAWDLGPTRGLLLWVKLRFWSKQRPLPLSGNPVRLSREAWPTSLFKFNWFVTGGRSVKRVRQCKYNIYCLYIRTKIIKQQRELFISFSMRHLYLIPVRRLKRLLASS